MERSFRVHKWIQFECRIHAVRLIKVDRKSRAIEQVGEGATCTKQTTILASVYQSISRLLATDTGSSSFQFTSCLEPQSYYSLC